MASIDIPLKGKILLITGGASGIGLSLVRQAHDLGARILVADLRTTPEFDAFSAGKDNILYIQSDVTNWSDFNKIFDACEKKWNDVPDAYGISAGLFDPPYSSFWLDTEEESYKQVEVNVNHPMKLTRLAMKKSLGRGKRASVCIISSVAGLGGNVAVPIYCATKHAMVGFVKSLKDSEPLTGVKVTAICPGPVDTPMFTSSKREQFSLTTDKALTPDSVATHMLDLLQKKEYECGTILELTTNGTRLIPEWNVAPPASEGPVQELAAEAMLKAMIAPIVQKLETERGRAKL